MDPLVIGVISACTALVASIVGPVVTLVVAKRQFNATVLSANRQKWIETLRDMIAEFVSLLVAALVVRSRWKDKWDKGRGALAQDAALLEKLQRMVLAQARIRLLLNPTEADHERLREAIAVAITRLQSDDSPDADTQADIEAITAQAQAILKREWHRVKLGT
jgi:hypothetical protein